MIYGLILTGRARADILRNAQRWAENHPPNQAVLWFDAIYQQLEKFVRCPSDFRSHMGGYVLRSRLKQLGNLAIAADLHRRQSCTESARSFLASILANPVGVAEFVAGFVFIELCAL